LQALNGDQGELGVPSIYRLMDAVDNYLQLPPRALDKVPTSLARSLALPFLESILHCH